jgi:hypothetical protein
MLLLVYLFTDSRIAVESPTVRAALKSNGLSLEVTAKAAGLHAEEQMFVYAYGLRVTEVDSSGLPTQFVRELFYTSQTGPDKAGAIDLTFEVPVPVGRYYSIGVAPSLEETRSLCSRDELSFAPPESVGAASPPPAEERKAACLVILVPPTSSKPQLFGTLVSPDGETHNLQVELKATNVGVGQTVLVRVTGLGRELSKPLPMYNAVLGPDATGAIEGSISLPVDGRLDVVCVQAAPLGLVVRPPRADVDPARLACPQRISSLSTIVRIPIR